MNTHVQQLLQEIQQQINLKNHRQIIRSSAKALRKFPQLKKNPSLISQVSTSLYELGYYRQAASYARLSAKLMPASSKALFYAGRAELACLNFQSASSWFEKAELLEPDFAKNLMGRGFIYLTYGQFALGWPLYEQRKRIDDFQPRKVNNVPMWEGGDIKALLGKTIFVAHEQGLGDTLMFARYVLILAHAGAKVVLLVQPSLVSWFNQLIGTYGPNAGTIESIVSEGMNIKKTDYWAALPSLPALIGAHVKPNTPYLKTAPIALPKPVIPHTGAVLKVGLAWSGEQKNSRNAIRSFDFKYIAQLLDIPNVQFYSLQLGSALEQAQKHPLWSKVIPLDNPTDSFLHTAQQIAALDLVITVDTSILHATGAQGKLFWALLDSTPDWRNGLPNASVHPFYPNSRLFRMRHRADRFSTIMRLKEALHTYAKTHLSQQNVVAPKQQLTQAMSNEHRVDIVNTPANIWSGQKLKLNRLTDGVVAFDQSDTQTALVSSYKQAHDTKFFKLFKAVVPQSAVVLEIGAYIGMQTIGIAKHVLPTSTVISFEVQRQAFQYLQTNITLNELFHVRCNRAVVGQSQGTIRLPVSSAADSPEFTMLNKPQNGEPIQAITIDSLNFNVLNCLVVDVNGMEHDVVLGANKTLDSLRPIVSVRVYQKSSLIRLIDVFKAKNYHYLTFIDGKSHYVWFFPVQDALSHAIAGVMGLSWDTVTF